MSKSINTLDEMVKLFFGASLSFPAIIHSLFGLDTQLTWIPVIFYAFWILIIGYYKPSRVFSDFPERALLERIRGWTYAFSLVVTMIMNYLLLAIFPKSIFSFFIGTFSVAVLLVIIVRFLPRALFRKELTFMSKLEEMHIYLMLQESGVASIYFSLSILMLNLEFLESTELVIANIIITLLIAGALFFRALSTEKKSSKLALDYAIDIKNSNWYEKYSRNQRRMKKKGH